MDAHNNRVNNAVETLKQVVLESIVPVHQLVAEVVSFRKAIVIPHPLGKWRVKALDCSVCEVKILPYFPTWLIRVKNFEAVPINS